METRKDTYALILGSYLRIGLAFIHPLAESSYTFVSLIIKKKK